MSLRYEQYWSLIKTQKFLRDLFDTKTRPKTVKELKNRAYSCLRHFPFLKENGMPYFSRDQISGPCECDYLNLLMKINSSLRLIATGPRPDGTYNRDRLACQKIAEDHIKEIEEMLNEAQRTDK